MSSFAFAGNYIDDTVDDDKKEEPRQSAGASSTGLFRPEVVQAGRQRMQAGLATLGSALQQKINRLQQQQQNSNPLHNLRQVADHVKADQEEERETDERNLMIQESLAACKAEMESHLQQFLLQHPAATYEAWIQDLHPENVAQGKLLQDFQELDLRFYVADSDHRLMWNAAVPADRQVAARQYQTTLATEPVDLLDDVFGVTDPPPPASAPPTVEPDNTAPTNATTTGTNNNNNNNVGGSVDLLGLGWP